MSISTFYVAASTQPGDSVRFSDLESAPRRHGFGGELGDPITQELSVIDLASYSDYSGSAVERSNYRVLMADENIAPHLVEVYGSHGSAALAFLGSWDDLRSDPAREDLRDAVSALSEYPVLSDDDHSYLEAESEDAAWSDYGALDFRRALQTLFAAVDPEHEHDVDAVDDATLADLWRRGCDAFNVNGGSGCAFETGGAVHFYVREWIDTAQGHRGLTRNEYLQRARAEMDDLIGSLAIKCREVQS